MGKNEIVLACFHACERIAINQAHLLFRFHVACHNIANLGTHEHLFVLWFLDFRTCHSDCAGEVNNTFVEKSSDENDLFGTQCPNHFTLVDGVDVVDLNANITCRALAVEYGHFRILRVGKRAVGLDS